MSNLACYLFSNWDHFWNPWITWEFHVKFQTSRGPKRDVILRNEQFLFKIYSEFSQFYDFFKIKKWPNFWELLNCEKNWLIKKKLWNFQRPEWVYFEGGKITCKFLQLKWLFSNLVLFWEPPNTWKNDLQDYQSLTWLKIYNFTKKNIRKQLQNQISKFNHLPRTKVIFGTTEYGKIRATIFYTKA